MFPANTIMRAAARWLQLLRESTIAQATSIISANSDYTDLTQTQYALGLDWLRDIGLLIERDINGFELRSGLKELNDEQLHQILFERILECSLPPWLIDADILVPDAAEIPQDAATIAETLELTEKAALLAIRRVHGRVDLAQRARVGLAGEVALVDLLEQLWPGSTTRVSEASDGFGFDVLFRHEAAEWHLETKTTTRRGRLVIYLSRHEYEVSLIDPQWRLVIVGLNEQMQLEALATVRNSAVVEGAPLDANPQSKWQSVSHELTGKDLQAGLSFLSEPLVRRRAALPLTDYDRIRSAARMFSWMPNE